MSTPGTASLLAQAKEHLRAQETPVEQWKQLCAFLSGLKAAEQASLLKGLDTMLSSFPPAVRSVWPEWLARQRQGQRVPAMQLARALTWTGPKLDAPSLRTLLTHPDFPRLRRLKLFGQDLDGQAVELLLRAPRLRQLESLNLASNRIDGSGLHALAGQASKLKLTQLFLGRNQIRDPDTRWLLDEPTSSPLELLCLRDNAISEPRRQELEAHFANSKLELRLASAPAKSGIPKRKRGRPSKKKPPST